MYRRPVTERPEDGPAPPLLYGAWLVLGLSLSLVGVYATACLGADCDPFGSPATDALLSAGAWTRERLEDGQWWRVLTAWTAHASVIHVGLNLGWWALAGTYCARRFGPEATFAVFVAAAMLGHVASAAVGNPASAGASGGAYGLLGWILADFWRRRADRNPDGSASPWVTWGLPVALIATLAFPAGGDRVDRWAHGVGALAGVLACWGSASALRQLLAPLAAAVALAGAAFLLTDPVGPPQLQLPAVSSGRPYAVARGAELAARSATTSDLLQEFPELAPHVPPTGRCARVSEDGTSSVLVRSSEDWLSVVTTTRGNWRRYAPVTDWLTGGRCPSR